jgi:hypothetical protein
MLALYKGSETAQPHENRFFRGFAKELARLFEERAQEGVLLGFPENSEIPLDALLITGKGLAVIEFKNYGGTIKLPDSKGWNKDPWVCSEGEGAPKKTVLSGGDRHENPFKQVQHYRNEVRKLLNSRFDFDTWFGSARPRVSGIVCFHHEVSIEGSVPEGQKYGWFHIAHAGNYLAAMVDNVMDVKPAPAPSFALLEPWITDFLRAKFPAQEYDLNPGRKGDGRFASASRTPTDARLEQMRLMHERLGFDRRIDWGAYAEWGERLLRRQEHESRKKPLPWGDARHRTERENHLH